MWSTFYPQNPAGLYDEGFGAVSMLNELVLQPHEASSLIMHNRSDVITYVHKGTIALVGPMRYSGVIIAGKFQHMSIDRVQTLRVTNTSDVELAHYFRIFLISHKFHFGGKCRETHGRFTAAQRHNVLCRVASREKQRDSLQLNTDASVYSSIVDSGQHIVYELIHGRKAWLHIVYGKVVVNGSELHLGDAMGITDEPSISLTAKERTELLLIDSGSGFANETGK
jgi:redox-sensitive bicupin YhaK (pirin superfamily)